MPTSIIVTTPNCNWRRANSSRPSVLEQLQSDAYCFFNERSLVTDLVPNRDLGVELHGDLFGGAASYAAGIFNGVSDYNGTTVNTDSDNDKAFAGRIFLQPWKTTDVNALKGLGFGVGGSFESDRNGAAGLTPGYTTDGQQKFFTYSAATVANGQHWRLSPQGYYYYGPLGILGEYAISDQDVSERRRPGGFAKHGLGNFRRLGVDGRRRLLQRRDPAPSVQSAQRRVGRLAGGRALRGIEH